MNSEPATSTEPAESAAWVCALLQTADSFYPTGSYAHSFGLEGLVAVGVIDDAATFGRFLRGSAVPLLGRLDLPIVAHAYDALQRRDWREVGEIAVLAAALKTTREIRTASEAIGRQRAELLARLQPNSIASDYVAKVRENAWPHCAGISAALEACGIGAPLAAALSAYAYSNLASLVAAAMKLLRIGQNQAQLLLRETLAAVPPLLTHAPRIPLAEIGWYNPWLDVASARHESADARMFIS